MNNALYYLDATAVRQSMRTQELKQYWVAEQAGVHVTTFRRWMSRRIFQVRAKHIVKLAAVLNVAPHEIVHSFPAMERVKGKENVDLPGTPLNA